MNTSLWIAQIIVALGFLYSGISKTFLSEKKLLAIGQTGVEGLSPGLIRFIGVVELAAVAGIILPWLLSILPVLTPVSAACMAVIMVPAAVIHAKRKEPGNVLTNVFLFSLSLFVAAGRFSEL